MSQWKLLLVSVNRKEIAFFRSSLDNYLKFTKISHTKQRVEFNSICKINSFSSCIYYCYDGRFVCEFDQRCMPNNYCRRSYRRNFSQSPGLRSTGILITISHCTMYNVHYTTCCFTGGRNRKICSERWSYYPNLRTNCS